MDVFPLQEVWLDKDLPLVDQSRCAYLRLGLPISGPPRTADSFIVRFHMTEPVYIEFEYTGIIKNQRVYSSKKLYRESDLSPELKARLICLTNSKDMQG